MPQLLLNAKAISVPAVPPQAAPSRRHNRPPSAAGVAVPASEAAILLHDIRNFLSGVELVCHLLSEPGVLAPGHGHYAGDLRRLGRSGASLVERLAPAADGAADTHCNFNAASIAVDLQSGIPDLAKEVRACRGILEAYTGPKIRLEIDTLPCPGGVALDRESLLRILINLVANATEALRSPHGAKGATGVVRITVQPGSGAGFTPSTAAFQRFLPAVAPTILLAVRDNGPGIPARSSIRRSAG